MKGIVDDTRIQQISKNNNEIFKPKMIIKMSKAIPEVEMYGGYKIS